MVFASSIFLFWFLPAILLLYYAAPSRNLKLVVLTAASVLFYAWWRPDFVLLMVVSSVVDYFVGGALPKTDGRGKRRLLLLASLVVNLGLLGYFKYMNFGVEAFNQLLGLEGGDAVTWPEIVLPVGISFYTFQSMSYTIDVYWGQVRPIRNFLHFFAYVSMFPQLVAGPIVRFRDIATQLVHRVHSWRKVAAGALLFQMGFCKKVLLADSVAPLANAAFALAPTEAGQGAPRAAAALQTFSPTFAEAWLGTLAYTFQIYFDFSGYSDMAIGLGLMMGFVFPINFDSPYKSKSITEFWRRWHISLSSWLRDYLYIPLGGNRRGIARMYVALMLTMLLGGLWHGASWNYIAWGGYQGFWLVLERASGRKSFYHRAPAFVQVAVTFVIAMVGWVFFRAEDLSDAVVFLKAMVGMGPGGVGLEQISVAPMQVWALVAGAAVVWSFRPSQRMLARPGWVVPLLVPTLFLLAVAHMIFQQYLPFLYFQF